MKTPIFNQFAKQLGRMPTREECEAIHFVIANSRRSWRKRYSESLKDFMARKPPSFSDETWRTWYFAPYGVPEWNNHITTMRRLLAGETPPEGFQMPEQFTLKTAAKVLGATL